MERRIERLAIIVLDSVGIGELPDAWRYGDEGSNTLGNIASSIQGLTLPNLASMGLGHLGDFAGIPRLKPIGVACKVSMMSPGKDTTTGHWELAGVILEHPFKTYPNGFPQEIIEAFSRSIGRGILGNKPASGTEIIRELGELHVETGRPIVYTSADSVFQIACHEEVVDLEELYSWCRTARRLLTGEHQVARVIARPFVGRPGGFVRTANRKDFSLEPPEPTLLDYAEKAGVEVVSIGKIDDVFSGRGISRAIHTRDNRHGVQEILNALAQEPPRQRQLLVANLVDFDMVYGHRNDVVGYARALIEFDRELPKILHALGPNDVLAITADHGCDPTTPSTDHSREHVPLLFAGSPIRKGLVLPQRKTLADLGATVADLLGFEYRGKGQSMAHLILE